VRVDEELVEIWPNEVCDSWPQPKNMRDVRKFLGLANYYRRFIKDFAQVARPMNILTRKDEKWQ